MLALIDAAATMTEQTLGRVRNLSLMLHPPQLETLGLEDYFGPRNLLLIEWGEKFPRLVRECDIEIAMERVGENDRRIRVIFPRKDNPSRV